MFDTILESVLPAVAPTARPLLLDRLRASTLPVRDVRPARHRELPGARWEAEAVWDDGERPPLFVRIFAVWTDHEFIEMCSTSGMLAPEIAVTMEGSGTSIGVLADVRGPRARQGIGALLRILYALSPNSLGVIDRSAVQISPPYNLFELVRSSLPPEPRSIFTVKGCYDHGPTSTLRTYGLFRCGVPELEVLDVPRELFEAMTEFIDVVVYHLLEAEQVEPGMRLFDDYPTPVLLVPGDGERLRVVVPVGSELVSPVVYGDSFAEQLVLPLPDSLEEDRAARAQEVLPRFLALLDQLGDSEAFDFAVNVAFPTSHGDPEGLWLEVERRKGDRLRTVCACKPLAVPNMKEGQRTWVRTKQILDVRVFTPLLTYRASELLSIEELASSPEMLELFEGMMRIDVA